MKRIYLDSNVLIAHFSVDKAEEAKKKLVENALVVFAHKTMTRAAENGLTLSR